LLVQQCLFLFISYDQSASFTLSSASSPKTSICLVLLVPLAGMCSNFEVTVL
jgi:hypothetical protein